MIATVSVFCEGVLALALVLAFVRVWRGPSLPDRLVALDLVATVSVGLIALHAIRTNEPVYLAAGIALALISFIGTVALALYIRREAPP